MAKENISKMKKEPTVWENIFANDISDNGLISKIQKRTHTTPLQEYKQSNEKMGKGSSSQDGGVGRHNVPPRTTKRRTTTI